LAWTSLAWSAISACDQESLIESMRSPMIFPSRSMTIVQSSDAGWIQIARNSSKVPGCRVIHRFTSSSRRIAQEASASSGVAARSVSRAVSIGSDGTDTVRTYRRGYSLRRPR